MGTFPPRSPTAQPSVDSTNISVSKIKKLDDRIKRLENGLEEIKAMLEEIRDLIKSQNPISREIFESHRHEYKTPEKLKKFVMDKTSSPILEE